MDGVTKRVPEVCWVNDGFILMTLLVFRKYWSKAYMYTLLVVYGVHDHDNRGKAKSFVEWKQLPYTNKTVILVLDKKNHTWKILSDNLSETSLKLPT